MTRGNVNGCALRTVIGWLCLLAGSSLLSSDESPQRTLGFESFLEEPCESDFTFSAILKPDPRALKGAEARVAFDWQPDSGGYYLSLRRQGVRFFKVVNGRLKGLGASHRWQGPPTEQAAIVLQRRGRAIRLIADGMTIASAADTQFTEGKIGLWTSNPQMQWQEVRYQPVEPINFADDFMRGKEEQSPWQTLAGSWGLQGARGEPGVPPPGITANPFTYRGAATEKGKALCIAGYRFWDCYSFAASVKPEGKGAVGLCGYYQSPSDYLLFRWSRGVAAGKKQLVLVRNGKETVLAESPGGYETNQWYWLELRVLPDKVEAFVDRQLALLAKSLAFGQGCCGLCVEGAEMSAQFDDVQVRSTTEGEAAAPFPQPNAVPEHYVRDRYLREWATEEGSWVRTPGETFWHRGVFFSDPSVSLSLAPTPAPGAKVWAAISAEQRSLDSGYRLELERNSEGFQWTLFRNGAAVKSVTAKAEKLEEGKTLLFRKANSTVSAYLNDEATLTYEDPKPLRGLTVGYGVVGWPIPPAKASARCPNLADFTFSSAPVHWRVERGLWETEPHWACVGRGSHLMGMDVGAAVLWSKEQFSGDLLIEAFLTNAELPAHVLEAPRNLNITVCGDGVNLGSGYSFLLGGSEGKEARVLREGQEIARTPFQTKRRIAHNEDIWFYLRIEKSGPVVSFSVDGQQVAQYSDPKPLDGGHIALWTYRTGMVLGRLRIWHEQEGDGRGVATKALSLARGVESNKELVLTGARSSPPGPVTPSSGAPTPVSDFETGFGTFSTRDSPDAAILVLDPTTAAKGKRSLKVVNRTCGGNFGAWALNQSVDLERCPVLSFDYKVPKGVKVNLYVRVRGRWEEIAFSGRSAQEGADQEASRPQPLGAIENAIADNRWHHARLNLLDVLRKRDKASAVIEGLALASPEDFALRCGLTGNAFGASYHLDNFRLSQ